MAKYYNKTNGPLTLGLRDGSSALVASKKWITILSSQDGSTDLIKKVQKGYLVRKKESGKSPSILKTEPLEKKVVVSEISPKEELVSESEPESESKPVAESLSEETAVLEPGEDSPEEPEESNEPEEISDAPMKKRKRRKKI